MTDSQRELNEQNVTLIYEREVRIYRNNQFLPRGFLVYEYRMSSSDTDTVASIISGELTPERETILQKEPAIPIIPGPAAANRVDILSYKDNEIVLEIESSHNGILVVSDTFYPGWKAFVDDAPIEILKAFGVMKAVAVPAGKHVVRFVYDPLSFKLGILISVISLITFLTYFLTSLLEQRRPSGQHR